MSNIEEALSSKLLADSNVTALISSRLHAQKIPQGSIYPAVAYRRIDTIPTTAMGGTSSTLLNVGIEYKIWAKKSADAKNVANKIRGSLDGLDATILGVRIYGIVYDTELDIFEDDTQLFCVRIDFNVQFTQT